MTGGSLSTSGCAFDTTGTLTVSGGQSASYGQMIKSSGTTTLSGGTHVVSALTGTLATDAKAYGEVTGGEFTIAGATLSTNTRGIDLSGGTLKMTSGSLGTSGAAALTVGAGTTAQLSGGSITQSNEAAGAESALVARGTVTLTGASVTSTAGIATVDGGSVTVTSGFFRAGSESMPRATYPTTTIHGGYFTRNDVAGLIVTDYYDLVGVADGTFTEVEGAAPWYTPMRSLAKSGAIADIADQTYADADLEPAPEVSWTGTTYGETTAKEYKIDDPSHYVCTYVNNHEVGTATVKVKGDGEHYTGEISKDFNVVKRSIARANATFQVDDMCTTEGATLGEYIEKYEATYIHKEIEPKVQLTIDLDGDGTDDHTLVEDTDFDVTYANQVDAGTAYIVVNGIGDSYTGSMTDSYTINPKDMTDAEDVHIAPVPGQAHTGEAIEPPVTVTYTPAKGTDETLEEGKDYATSYENNIEITVGDNPAVVTATGTGNYKGTISTIFRISGTVASVIHEGVSSNFASVQQAVDACQSGDTLVMAANTTEDAIIPAELTLTFDLAGHTLTGAAAASAAITNNGNLKLVDSGVEGADPAVLGQIVAAAGKSAVANKGTLEVAGATITSGHATAPALINQGTAETAANLTITSGTISGGNWAVDNQAYASVVMRGGTVSNTAAAPLGALRNANTASILAGNVTATGHAICTHGSYAKTSESYPSASGTTTLNGGAVSSTGASPLLVSGSGDPTVTIRSGTVSYPASQVLATNTCAGSSITSIVGGHIAHDDANTNAAERVSFEQGYQLGAEWEIINGTPTTTTGWYVPMKTIAEAEVVGVDPTYPFYGSEFEPTITSASWISPTSGATDALTRDTHYTVSYRKGTQTLVDDSSTPLVNEALPLAVGSYKLVLTGKTAAGYTGERVIDFEIVKANVSRDVTFNDIGRQPYNGFASEPELTLYAKDGKTKLVENTDYRVTYESNTDAGTARALVYGIGNSFEGMTYRDFQIVPSDINTTALAAIPNQAADGTAKTPEPVMTFTSTKGGEERTYTLVQGRDYEATYTNNIEIGTATIAIKGINNFYGERETTFNVVTPVASVTRFGQTTATNYGTLQAAIDDAPLTSTVRLLEDVTEDVTVPEASSFTLDLAGKTINGTLTNNGSVTIANEAATGGISSSATALVTGGATIIQAGTYTTSGDVPVIAGTGNVRITGGTFSYPMGATALDASTSATITAGTTDNKPSFSAADANSSVVFGYELARSEGETLFTPKPSVAYAVIEGVPGTSTFNNADQTPEPTRVAYSTNSSEELVLVKDTDYTVAYYSDAELKVAVTPHDAGTYYVAITGQGAYTGTKAIRFVIEPKSISSATLGGLDEACVYAGGAPVELTGLTVSGIFEGVTLDATKDYTVAYENNTQAGNAFVTCTGTGNYTGHVSGPFAIARAKATLTGVTTAKTYLNDDPNLTPEDTGVFDADRAVLNIHGTREEGEDVRAGGYATSATYDVSPNYDITVKSGTLTINQASLAEVTPARASAEYTGGDIAPTNEVTYTYTSKGEPASYKLVLGTDYTLSKSDDETVAAFKDVAEYSVAAHGIGNFTGTSLAQTFEVTETDKTELAKVIGIDPDAATYESSCSSDRDKTNVSDDNGGHAYTVEGDTVTQGETLENGAIYVTSTVYKTFRDAITTYTEIYNNKNVTAEQVATAVDNLRGAKRVFDAAKRTNVHLGNISDSKYVMLVSDVTYDGERNLPEVKVFEDKGSESDPTTPDGAYTPEVDTLLLEDTDYTLAYYKDAECTQEVSPTNVGTYYAKAFGAGSYYVEHESIQGLNVSVRSKEFHINRASLKDDSTVTVSGTYTYNRATQTPQVTVTNTKALVADGDYTLEWSRATDFETLINASELIDAGTYYVRARASTLTPPTPTAR